MTDSESIVKDLIEEHGINSFVVVCPCTCDANSETGHPVKDCPYCHGEGKIQYGIDEVEFFS
jgi:hypothetical protein